MKINFNDPKFQKGLGIFIVAFSLALLLGIGCWMFFGGSDDTPAAQEGDGSHLTDAKREAALAELAASANGEEDVDPETAKEIMGLEVITEGEMIQSYLGGEKALKAAMEDYLVTYDFYADVTRAVCTQVFTIDLKKGTGYTEFRLNDPGRTILMVTWDGTDYTFNFR